MEPTKEIATLPPLPVLTDRDPPSPRTGEPRRPWPVAVAHVLFQLAVAGVALAYAVHWWLAAHPESYPTSARLIEWLAPDPGKWLSLTVEGVLAIIVAVTGGALGVAGFQAWNGWRWSRWAGLVAVGLTGWLVALLNWWAAIPLGLAVVAAALPFLPRSTRFFAQFAKQREHRPEPYRRPQQITYGRLPRYR